MISILKDSFDQKAFNQCASHPLQAWQWGDARKAMGLKVLRIGEIAENSSELMTNFQITFHPLPKLPYSIGYIPRSAWPSPAVLDFLHDYGRKNKIIFFKFEPNVLKKDLLDGFSHSLTPSTHPLFPTWTQILDITPTEDELLMKMHSKTRYNIRLAQKKGVEIKEMSNQAGFDIFTRLYFATTDRQKYYGHTQKYHQIIWDHLKHDFAHLLIAFYQDTPIAAYELFLFHDRWYYPYGGSSEQFRNVMAANLLMWEAIRLGKQLRARSFDMWGSLAPDYSSADPWAGFTRFKQGYGAEFVEMAGSYDLVVNPTIYKVYNTVYKLRSKYLSLTR